MKIQEGAYRYQKEIESGERILIGVNKFKTDEPVAMRLHKVDPQVEKLQLEKLARVRSSRDSAKVKQHLAKLKEAAQGNTNLMVLILDATRDYVTLGEICGALKEVFGEYKGSTFI